MEKSLIEKMENGTCDEVDKDMIASRCMKALKEVLSCCSKFGDDIKKITEEYKTELRLAGFAIVCGVTDGVIAGGNPSLTMVLGESENCKSLVKVLAEESRIKL